MNEKTIKKVLILGATGNFGRAHAEALLDDGWQLNILLREPNKLKSDTIRNHSNVALFKGDALNKGDLLKAGKDCSVIIHGINMPYNLWETLMPKITQNIMEAAKTLSATILFPGNIYNYSPNDGVVYHEQSPQNPVSKKGKFRKQLEQDMAHFAQIQGVQIIILRAGDYWGADSSDSSFFKYLISDNLPKGKILYAGANDKKHAWAYLPDLGKTGVAILNQRESLNLFEIFHFTGNDLTMDEMASAVEKAYGKKLKRGKFPWAIIKIIGFFNKAMYEMLELRFMGSVAQSLDENKLTELLGDVPKTPLDKALKTTFEVKKLL